MFRLSILLCLVEHGSAFVVEHLVLLFELIVFLLRICLFCLCVCQFCSDLFLTGVDGIQEWLTEKTLQHPNQDQKVQELSSHREPVDKHRSLTCRMGKRELPEGIREDENHRDDKAIDCQRLDHG